MSGFHPDTVLHLKNELVSTKRLITECTRSRDVRLELARNDAKGIALNQAKARDLRELLRQVDPDNAFRYEDPEQDAPDLDQRAAVIAGLRELADVLEMQPDAPVLALRHLAVYGHQHDAADDEAEISRYATALGVTAVREHPAVHFEATRKFGPGGAVRLRLISTHGSTIRWKLGDPMPSGVPAEVVARYAKQWHDTNPDDGACPYPGACETCFSSDGPVPVEREHLSSQLLHEASEVDEEPPGGEADVALLDAEQAAYREAAVAEAAQFAEVDEAAYYETSAQYEGFGESAAVDHQDDAPQCRECGTWPCSRHGTEEDIAEQAAAEASAAAALDPEGADA